MNDPDCCARRNFCEGILPLLLVILLVFRTGGGPKLVQTGMLPYFSLTDSHRFGALGKGPQNAKTGVSKCFEVGISNLKSRQL